MSWVPVGTALGRLEIDETFEFYDGPRLFAASSASGQRYLAAWAEEAPDHDLWLYLPISNERFSIARSGGITVRAAFLNAEDFVYLVRTPTDGENVDTIERLISGPEIQEEWLPGTNYRIERHTDTAPRAERPSELARRAMREARPFLRVEVEPTASRRTVAPTRAVGNLLVLTQNLLDNMGYSQALSGREAALRGRVPTNIQETMASEIVSLTAASFVIDIASMGFMNLFGSPFEDSSNAIVLIFSMDDTKLEFKEQVKSLNTRAQRSFRSLVKQFDNIGGPVSLVAANESAEFTEAKLSSLKIQRMLATLNYLTPDQIEPEVRARMRLFRGDVDHSTFGADNPSSEQTYTGYVDEQALSGFKQAPLGAFYDMVLSVTSVTDELTNATQYTYRLMQINPVPTDGATAP
ncbi:MULTISPECIES: DUF6575 domain-containing protein [Rhodococcus]|uniref:DUF6575 domain-containing protein n=1 Tax=Rhodococcus cerastii TaxID=908616 RepID=A0ABU4D1W9_9NOCA|nr:MULTISPECIES: DUF6575 domain-containing protein [Rhodococcus]MDV6303723.1 DUF6575 domain-containing protein [Rhodococcus cerastii]MDV8058268.1 DUF6575 domain-containing protein [Rhodococcus sp. IEGM 1343]